MARKTGNSPMDVCTKALTWARARDYTGYNKHDGLNSPFLRTLTLGNKWLRIAAIQAVMRAPINIRPLVGVRKVRNPKGIALFARSYLNLYRITGESAYLDEAKRLLDWLGENTAPGFPGMSWGYGYPWQDLGFYAPPGFPNRIVTYFVGRAFVDAFEVTGDATYLDCARRVVEFILEAPKVLFEDGTMKCVSYVPVEDITMAVMDVSALCGALCAMVGKHAGIPAFLAEAKRLVHWVVDKQTDEGAWFYTHPAGDSHITHDNYHTGEIVEALRDYMEYSGDTTYAEAYERGLRYYRDHLFTPAGEPKWMNDTEYPYDIHGYAVGIITFTKAGDGPMAEKILQNAVRSMWDEREGRFYYQRRNRYTKRFTLMRWCQAWMACALSINALAAHHSTSRRER